MLLSVVIPLLNEADNLPPLFQKVRTALRGYDYELILVDDGSTDRTVEVARELADERTRLVVLSRNYGQSAAMSAGIDLAQGSYIVTLDGDLQNDPDDIPMMLERMAEGRWDVVAGRRKNRQDGALLRKLPSKIANGLIRRLTGVYLSDYGCTLKLFRREIAKNLGLYGQLHRFIPVLTQLQGGRMLEVDVRHHARLHGVSKYGLGRTSKVVTDLLLMLFLQRYFQRPIHLFGGLGLLSLAAGMGIDGYLLVCKLLGQDIWGRPLLILGVTLLLAGIQFLIFGILAELLMRIYYESQDKRPYYIREVFSGAATSQRAY